MKYIKASVKWNLNEELEDDTKVHLKVDLYEKNDRLLKEKSALWRADAATQLVQRIYDIAIGKNKLGPEHNVSVLPIRESTQLHSQFIGLHFLFPFNAETDKEFRSWQLKRFETQYSYVDAKHFIFPRSEVVNQLDYFAFYGSGGHGWDERLFTYPLGDYVETIDQTIYEMLHGNPEIYSWTNVPKLGISNYFEINPEFKKFYYAHIFPIQRELDENEYHKTGNLSKHVAHLAMISSLAQTYKMTHKIPWLYRYTGLTYETNNRIPCMADCIEEKRKGVLT